MVEKTNEDSKTITTPTSEDRRYCICQEDLGNEGGTCVFKDGKMPCIESTSVGEASPMPGASGFTMVVFRASDVPVGTKLYKEPQALEDIPVAWVDEKAEVLKFGGWDAQPFAKSFKPVFYKAKK